MTRLVGTLWRRPWITLGVLAILTAIATLAWTGSSANSAGTLTAVVTRGQLSPRITASGILHPVQSTTYRSPLGGRDAELTFLVAEGTRVNEGDLLVRLDTTELQRELERTTQERRQALVDQQVADVDRQQARAAVESLTAGEGAIGVEEAATRIQLAQKKADRLKEELAGLQPLMTRGFITREEFRRTADALEQADEELSLARRRQDVLTAVTRPQERQRAELTRAQKDAQYENVRARAMEVEARLQRLAEQLEGCSIFAKRPGLVVYEEYVSANPRRKIRLGDRVTGTQGIVTIPDTGRAVVETSIAEADVHRVRAGQKAVVQLEAFPGLSLSGKVAAIGALAGSSADRPLDDKRFDVTIALDPTNIDVRPEMTARADIQLGERPAALLVPAGALFERGGTLVCHVVRRFDVETRAVEVGETDGVMVEVISGLNEGDRVALADTAGSAPASAGAPTSTGSKKPIVRAPDTGR